MGDRQFNRASQDVGNILALEHVNLTVPDQELAYLFYVTVLGFTRDPYMDFGTANMWINLGSQQFHLPKGSVQRFNGRIGVIVPSIEAISKRLTAVKERMPELAGSLAHCETRDGTLVVTCPWGNTLCIHEPDPRFGAMTIGIPYVDINIPAGGAAGVVEFYQGIMGCPAEVLNQQGDTTASVRIGRYQAMIFRETAEPMPAYDGHHVAVYLNNFSKPYERLQELGLVSMETNDSEYRFQKIVDPASAEVIVELEHEVRSMFHPMFGRELVNRNPGQSFFNYQQGHDAQPGLNHGGLG